MPEASVVVPHYQDPARLFRCLSTLMRDPQISRCDVIVVNSGPVPLPKTLRAHFPEFQFFSETAPGAARARNRGVKEASAELLCFLDCDCVPAPDWVEQSLAQAKCAPISGGAIELFDEDTTGRTGAQAFETVFGFQQADYIARKGFSVTANLITNRQIFDIVGPFRDGVSEDFDWCQRAASLGYRVSYAPNVIVQHPTRQDWPALRKKWDRIVNESYDLRRSQTQWIMHALVMPLSCLWHLPLILKSRDLRSPQERARAASTLARLRLWRMWQMIRLSLTRGRRHPRNG